jgi:hypothetical protein
MIIHAIPRSDNKTMVICGIRVRPIDGKGFHVIGPWDAGSPTLVQDNVQCVAYPSSRERARAEYRKLRNTVRDMAVLRK